MRVGYIGNFVPPHSTENHISRALLTLGHRVERYQENDTRTWRTYVPESDADVLLWTHTGSYPPDRLTQIGAIESYRRRHHPQHRLVVGVHLDRWWGLDREVQITEEHKPFFYEPDVLYTADGAHERQWADVGIVHRWFPPGVSAAECEPGVWTQTYASDVAFVGSWQKYHTEWPHRHDLIEWLTRSEFDVQFWPHERSRSVRGSALRHLYASVKVVVGDSCLAPTADGKPMSRYCSDRIPETLGRNGFLLHPDVEGVTDGGLFTAMTDLGTWPVGDWDRLGDMIQAALDFDDTRNDIAAHGRATVLARHTYEVRMAGLLDEVIGGLVP